MGGVCPCLAGAEKAATEVKAKPASAKPPTETQPLVKESAPAAAADNTLPSNDVGDSGAATGETAGAEGLRVGSFLDIYSNSYQAWCHGVVQAMESDSVFVVYQVPVGESHQTIINTKTLPIDSQEIRAPSDDGPWLGSIVEVFSHSHGQWLPARIQMIVNGLATVAFYYPNTPEGGDAVQKQLPLGDKDLRLPGADASVQPVQQGHFEVNTSVEVYSHSLAQWLPAVIQDIQPDHLKVAFYYPEMDATKEEPMYKELPIGTQDVRLPTTLWQNNGMIDPNVNAADFVEGNPIEVFSHSRQVWIKATIKEVSQAGMLTASFRYPDMPENSELYEKVLPVGHADFRLPVAEAQ